MSIDVGHEPVSLQLVCLPSPLTELAFRHIEALSVLECSGKREMGSGMSIDLSRRPTYALPTWRNRLESSCTANVFPSWRGNLRNISVL